MKIAGKTLGKRSTKVVVLDRAGEQFTFTVQALPLGFLEGTLLERLPPIVPKKQYAMKHGKILRDENNRFVEEDNLADPVFQVADRKRKVLMGVATLYEGLRADATIGWETTPDKFPNNWEGFYQAIYQELIDLGMVSGEMNLLSKEILDLSMNKQSDLEAARESFLSGAQPSVGLRGEFLNTQVGPKGT